MTTGMDRYLLDTNVVSALMKAPTGALARHARQVPPKSLSTSIIVAGELRFGAIRRGNARLLTEVEAALNALEVLPLDGPVDLAYGRLRAELERAGTPIGSNDLWIAAHALAAGCVLVTANEREFRRVPHLIIENWAE